MKYKKIRITGASGSGKTYLGKLISKKTKIPCFSTDDFTYINFDNYVNLKPRKVSEREKMFDDLLKKKSWILEGMRYTDCIKTYDDTNLIIYLKPSTLLTVKRIFFRDLSRRKAGKNVYLKGLLSIMLFNIRTWKRWQKRRPRLLSKKYGGKVKVFSSADEAYDWFCKQ